jgi:hypothetical protein
MKGKLIKTDVNFLLEDDKGVVIASTSLNKEGLSLSQKNCQAIENGYGLDELAMGYDLYENINFVGQMRAYKAGFQKALEILGDKKFSEEDMRMAFFHVQNEPTFDEFIQSLQQTEWDVEVVMVPAMSNNGNVYYGDIPKLDENGCLILIGTSFMIL